MDFDDIEISYIGEEEAIDDADNNEDLNEDYEPRSIRVNSNGKKVRGKDLNWTKKINFNNAKQYKDSNIVEDLEENYTLKRSNEYEYGTVLNYICKFNQKTRYQPCINQSLESVENLKIINFYSLPIYAPQMWVCKRLSSMTLNQTMICKRTYLTVKSMMKIKMRKQNSL